MNKKTKHSNSSIDKIINSIGKDLDNLAFEGGQGESFEDAVKIEGLQDSTTAPFAERGFLTDKYGNDRTDWTFIEQALTIENDKVYDVITVKLPNGSLEKVYFDITESYMKSTEIFEDGANFSGEIEDDEELIENYRKLVNDTWDFSKPIADNAFRCSIAVTDFIIESGINYSRVRLTEAIYITSNQVHLKSFRQFLKEGEQEENQE